jgi:dTDP-4-dehydrorhamnose reductase
VREGEEPAGLEGRSVSRPLRVLVTGAGGQLGRELVECLEPFSRTVEVVAAGHGSLDVSEREVVMEAVLSLAPDVVVHAAAWTAVDACEGDPERAFRVNSLGTRHVAEAARSAGAHLCYISTDYVFDGTAARPYLEWDRPNPLSVYGRSKLGGELELGPDSTVVRTSWVCGRFGANMVKTILRLAAGEGPMRFVDDQVGSPSIVADLAPAVRDLALSRRPGVFHVTNQGEASWYRFAREVVSLSGADPARVEPIATSELDPPRPAPRPAYAVLDNAALRLSGLPLLPHWQEALERLVKELA